MSATKTLTETTTQQEPLQILTFLLDKEVYGTDIGLIQEVLEYRKVTPIPRTPNFMLGLSICGAMLYRWPICANSLI